MIRSSRRTLLDPRLLLALVGVTAVTVLGLAANARPADAKVLVGQSATLTEHANGMPSSSDPGRRLQRAEVDVQIDGWGSDRVDGYVEAHVTLAGAPSTTWEDDAALMLGLGTAKGQTCEIRDIETSNTSGDAGREYELIENFRDIGGGWDCVVIAIDNGLLGNPTVTYDAMVAPLKDRFESPKPKIVGIELLRKKQKKLKLVRGTWTTLDIEVENTAEVDAKSLRVTGGGKKLRVKASPPEELPAGWSDSVELKVKPAGKLKRSKLKVVANTDGVKASRSLVVKGVKPPRPPANGSYESENGWIEFSIRKRKIVDWRGHMQTRCGGYPGIPTTSMNTYDFPSVKVGRNRIVNSTDKHELYTASLQLRAVGKKVTSGWFFYGGPGRCVASAAFTAKRTGR